MPSSFNWFVPGELAGCAQPGLLDPLEDDLAFLGRAGIEVIVTLTEKPLALPAGAPFELVHFPIDDMRSPQPREAEKICARIAQWAKGGRKVVVHCKGGLGRTGTMGAAYLVTLGTPPAEALAAVRKLNPRYVQTEGQAKFLTTYADYLAQRAAAEEATPDPSPDPAFYASIGGDEGVRRVLETFYDRVFVDPLLAPFFTRSDKVTLRAKQATFLRRCFLGPNEQYMGQRPRNAHHFMVISDAQFDHRREVMRGAMQDHGLTPAQIAKWLTVEEVFRRQIVKDAPKPLFYRGYETFWAKTPKVEKVEVATICDRCQAELPVGGELFMSGDQVLCRACVEAGSERV